MTDRNLTTKRFYGPFQTREGMVLYLPPSDVDIELDLPGVVDPFAKGDTQLFPLGTKLEYADRTFRYVKNGGVAMVVGSLYQQTVPLAGHIDSAIGEPAVGDKTIDFTPAVDCTDDLALNDLEDGYIFIESSTGAGEMYRIKSHPAIAGATSGVLTLYDPIRTAPAAGSTATVLFNQYKNLIVQPGPATARVMGVAMATVVANEFGWIQTKGPCAVLAENTLVIGEPVVASPADAGAVGPWVIADSTAVEQPLVGHCITVPADQEHGGVHLMLE